MATEKIRISSKDVGSLEEMLGPNDSLLQKDQTQETGGSEKPSEVEKYWEVKCLMCQTHVCLDIGDYRIFSTDQAAEFIRVPEYICGKCKSVCKVELREP